jgi:hypothetical protein
MAKRINADYVVINGSTLSSRLKTCNLTVDREIVDVTAMTDTYRDKLGSFRNWSASLEFYSDEAAANVNVVLNTMFALSTAATCTFRGTTAAISTTNPRYYGNAFLTNWTPLSGGAGEAAMVSVTLEGAGALTRSTS